MSYFISTSLTYISPLYSILQPSPQPPTSAAPAAATSETAAAPATSNGATPETAATSAAAATPAAATTPTLVAVAAPPTSAVVAPVAPPEAAQQPQPQQAQQAMSEAQTSQLKAQISVYQLLARHQAVPDKLATAAIRAQGWYLFRMFFNRFFCLSN